MLVVILELLDRCDGGYVDMRTSSIMGHAHAPFVRDSDCAITMLYREVQIVFEEGDNMWAVLRQIVLDNPFDIDWHHTRAAAVWHARQLEALGDTDDMLVKGLFTLPRGTL